MKTMKIDAVAVKMAKDTAREIRGINLDDNAAYRAVEGVLRNDNRWDTNYEGFYSSLKEYFVN